MNTELKEKYKRVCILQPLMHYIPSDSAKSLILLNNILTREGFEISYACCDRTFIEESRNQLFRFAAKYIDNYDVFIWIDSDQTYDANNFIALLKHYDEFNLDCLSAKYMKRAHNDNRLCAYIMSSEEFYYHSLEDIKENKIVEVDGVGFGFLLMRPDVIKRMYEVYNNTPFEIKCVNKDTLSYQGEDFAFCRKMKSQGFKIHLDCSVAVGHYGYVKYPEVFIAE